MLMLTSEVVKLVLVKEGILHFKALICDEVCNDDQLFPVFFNFLS